MDPLTGCDKEIEILIKSRYPLIYVVSPEEGRVIEKLDTIACDGGKELKLWSITRGIHDLKGDGRDEETQDPLNALDYVSDYSSPSIWVFLDFHNFITDHTLCRRLRDLVNRLMASRKTIILLSPVLTVPVELEKDMSIVDYDLPDYHRLSAQFAAILEKFKDKDSVSIDIDEDIKEKLVKSALGLTRNEAANAFARIIVSDKKLDATDIQKVLVEKKQIIRKSRFLEYFESQEEFSKVGGLDSLKDWLAKREVAFTERAAEFGIPQPKGVLLLGVQGCGKSLTAKAVSSLWKLPLLRLDMGSIFSGVVGSSEENMRKAIKTAESLAPIVLWIDEIEKGLAGVQSSSFSDAGTSSRVFSTFLTWLNEKTAPVFVIATANNITMLPPELLRKGRFDDIFFVDLPTAEERSDIFSIHLKKKGKDPEAFDLGALARVSDGFSGAEIEQAVISSLYDAFNEERSLETEDIATCIAKTVPLSVTMKEDIDSLRNWARFRARPASSKSPLHNMMHHKERGA